MEWSTISALHVLVFKNAFLRMGTVAGANSQKICLMFVCVYFLYICVWIQLVDLT